MNLVLYRINTGKANPTRLPPRRPPFTKQEEANRISMEILQNNSQKNPAVIGHHRLC